MTTTIARVFQRDPQARRHSPLLWLPYLFPMPSAVTVQSRLWWSENSMLKEGDVGICVCGENVFSYSLVESSEKISSHAHHSSPSAPLFLLYLPC